MKKRLILILAIVLLLSITFFTFKINNRYHHTVTSGVVLEKYKSIHYIIKIKKYKAKKNEKDIIKIIVKVENVWNLIETNRAYFLTYPWKNNEIPFLEQIQLNNELITIIK